MLRLRGEDRCALLAASLSMTEACGYQRRGANQRERIWMRSDWTSARVVFEELSATLMVKLTVILALVSTAWPFSTTGLKRHSRTACWAAELRMAGPLSTRRFCTTPSALISA